MKHVINAGTGKSESVPTTPEDDAQLAADASEFAASRAIGKRRERIVDAVDAILNSDAETQLLFAAIKKLAKDMAAQKGMTNAEYRAELISELQP